MNETDGDRKPEIRRAFAARLFADPDPVFPAVMTHPTPPVDLADAVRAYTDIIAAYRRGAIKPSIAATRLADLDHACRANGVPFRANVDILDMIVPD